MFEKELGYIADKDIREVVEEVLKGVPEYFYRIPASSTGKYHPKYATGEAGLYRHVQAAIRIAQELFVVQSVWWGTFSQQDKDVVIAALIFHDMFKKGVTETKYTVHEHPVLAADYILGIDFGDTYKKLIAETLASLVASHMGQWTTNRYSQIELPYPETRLQRFVHLCDFLASRKFLEVTEDVFT